MSESLSDHDIAELKSKLAYRMAGIQNKIAILGGKGGVGKSMLCTNLASGLTQLGFSVGILDADPYNPALSKMMGVTEEHAEERSHSFIPMRSSCGLPIISLCLQAPEMAESAEAASFINRLSWLGDLLAGTRWGSLDFLLLDLPSDPVQISLFQQHLFEVDGVIAVTIPTEVAHQATARTLSRLELLDVGVLGLVENMVSYYNVPTDREKPLFVTKDPLRYGNIPVLARLPFDYRMADACDRGTPFVDVYGKTPLAQALLDLCTAINKIVHKDTVLD